MSAGPQPHDPPAIFDALGRHQVGYVTVGGLAVGFWAHPRATKDTDIVVPDTDPENDTRLADALRALDAEPLPLDSPGARALGIRWEPQGDVERWQTSRGVLDVLRSPEGAAPFAELYTRAQPTSVFGAQTRIVAREDLVTMKLAAARVQDLLDLDALLDSRNVESERVRRRALDRDLLRGPDDPDELGDPIDPCEHPVDDLRRALGPVSARSALERALVRRARELRRLSAHRIATLARHEIPQPPASLDRLAADTGAAGRELEGAESAEFGLLRERKQLGRFKRRERAQVSERMDEATDRAEALRDQAEHGVEQLREGIAQIEAWWEQHGNATVEAIAARRERYRRAREQHSERVRAAPECPAEYIVTTIGARPADAAQRARWDTAARAIEAYVAQRARAGEEPLRPPEQPDRAARGAWERMRRAIQDAGAELSEGGSLSPAVDGPAIQSPPAG